MKQITIVIIVIILVTLGMHGYKHHEFCKKLIKEQEYKRIELAGVAFDECMNYHKNLMDCTQSYYRAKKFIQYMDYEELKNENCHP